MDEGEDGPVEGPAAVDEGDAAVDGTVLAELLESTGGDRDFLAELIDTYLDDAPRHIAAMRDAAVSGQIDDLARAAHTLKGSSASLGATRLSERARVLELAARAGTLDREAIDAIEGELDRVRAVLSAWRSG